MSLEHALREDDARVADDRLRGAEAIGKEINETKKRVYYLYSQGRLKGVYKEGQALIGSKRALRLNHHKAAREGSM
jgi:hypothetical protein